MKEIRVLQFKLVAEIIKLVVFIVLAIGLIILFTSNVFSSFEMIIISLLYWIALNTD